MPLTPNFYITRIHDGMYVRYYHKGEVKFPGLEAIMRHVQLPRLWARSEARYAQFGLDDEDKKRPEGVELPPLLMRGGSNNIAGGGASQRSVSPPKRAGD